MSTASEELLIVVRTEVQNAIADLQKVKKEGTSLGEVYKNIQKGLLLTSAAFIGAGVAAVKSAADFEKQSMAFETILGSAEAAKTLLSELQQFGAVTPFNMDNLTAASQQLLAFGIASKDILPTLTALGNASMGDAEKLGRLTAAYGKLAAKGKASLEELNMFTEAGVPILKALADNYGVTTEKMLNMITKGQIGFKDVKDALDKLTTGTGPFAGLMEKQGQSLSGMISTLEDSVSMLAKEIGTAMLPTIKDAVSFLTKLASSFNNMDDGTKKMIITFGLVAASAGPVVKIFSSLHGGIGAIITTAPKMASSVASMGASFVGAFGPAGVAVVAIGATIGALALINAALDDYQKKQKENELALQQSVDKWNAEKLLGKKINDDVSKVEGEIALKQKELYALKRNIENTNNEDIIASNERLIKQTEIDIKNLKAQLEAVKKLRDEANNSGKDKNADKDLKQLEYTYGLQGYLNDRRQTELDIISQTITSKNMLLDVNSIMGEQMSVTLEQIQAEANAFNNLKDSYKEYTTLVTNTAGTVFEALGDALVKGGDGWKAFAKAGVEAIASIVDALASKALVLAAEEAAAALASYPDVVGMGMHGAAAIQYGALGALGKVTAGAIRAIPLAQGGDFITNKPTPILVGDNSGGRERVTVEPVSSYGSSDYSRNKNNTQPIILQIDGREIWSGLLIASRDGIALLDKRAIV